MVLDIAGMGSIGTAMLLSWVVTVAFQLLCFSIANALKIDKITDLAGCTNFIIIAVMTLLLAPHDPPTTRQITLTALVCVSRFELGAFLLYRVLKRGKDSRFDQIREKCCIFLIFWIWQMVWVFGVSVGVIYVNAAPVPDDPIGAADWIGWVIIVFGFVLQTASDLIKNSFRADPANAAKVCDVGPWRYSRHPNFCGEVLFWWGVFICGAPVFKYSHAGWATCVAPLFTMLVLLAGSGIPTSEGASAKRWYDGGEAQQRYEAYFETTPPLWLFPPALYRQLPGSVKLLCCFELPMYRYAPALDDDSEEAQTSYGTAPPART